MVGDLNEQRTKNAAPSLQIPIETFERFMLEDSSEYPMSFAFGLTFDQALDRERLCQAIKEVLPRHPLLSATVDSHQKNWILNDREPCFVEDQDPTCVLEFDMEQENGLRVVLDTSRGPGESMELCFVVHHACTDGLGALGFITDVAATYSNESNLEEDFIGQKRSRVEFLKKHRRAYGRNRVLNLLRWPIDLIGMLWTYELIFNRPSAIQPDTKSSLTSNAIAEHLCITLDVSCTAIVKQNARSKSQTINDLILEASFLAIDQWFQRFAPSIKDPMIRLMVPVNLRAGIASRTNTAANLVAMVNLDRKPRKRRLAKTEKAKRSFSKGLRWEMALIKKFGAAVTANRFLQLQRLVFGGWPMLKKPERCLATCPVSNLGRIGGWNSETQQPDPSRPFVFGPATANAVRVIGPLRRNSNLMIIVYSYQNRLKFDLTFNPRCLERSQMEHLAELLKENVLNGTVGNHRGSQSHAAGAGNGS